MHRLVTFRKRSYETGPTNGLKSHSTNVIYAVNEAKKKNITTVALVGGKECKLETLCDYVIKVPSTSTPTIQESHLMIEHSICAIIEDEIFGGKDRS